MSKVDGGGWNEPKFSWKLQNSKHQIGMNNKLSEYIFIYIFIYIIKEKILVAVYAKQKRKQKKITFNNLTFCFFFFTQILL